MRPRVSIRPPSNADCDEFLAAVRRSRAIHRPWIAMPETRGEYDAYLERSRRESSAYFVAHRVDDDAIIGFLNISEIVRGKFLSAFLGYGGIAGFEGQGYMREALELVLREAFTKLGLHRLEATSSPATTRRSRWRDVAASSWRGFLRAI